ncbi:hypothetical protein D3C75_660620 [compost metagenome]
MEQQPALPQRLALRQPAAQRPAIGHAEKAQRRRHHLEAVALEAPARPRHVPGLGDQHDAPHPRVAQQRRTERGVFPGGAAAPFLPARHHAEVLLQHLGKQLGLARRRAEVQAATGEDRQAAGPVQARRQTGALQRQQARLIAAPAGIATLASAAEQHDGLGAPRQRRPLARRQRRLALQQPRRLFDHHRQAHQPQAAKAQHTTSQGQPRAAQPPPPDQQQQQEQAARRQQQLLEQITQWHGDPPLHGPRRSPRQPTMRARHPLA